MVVGARGEGGGEDPEGEAKDTRVSRSNWLKLMFRQLEAPVILRFQESRTRPKAVEDFQQAMFAGRAFLLEATQNVTLAKKAVEESTPENPAIPPKYTDEELKVVEVMMKELEEWVDDVMSRQIHLEADKTSDPVVMSKELDDKGKKLQSTVSLENLT